MLSWQPIKFNDLDKIHMNRRGLLKKHFFKKNLNICSETAIIANFHFSHYKSMETISFHSNQSSYLTGTKKHNYSSPPPLTPIYSCYRWNMKKMGFTSSEEKSFENVDDRRTTDGRRMPACTISSPMSLRLRWAKNIYERQKNRPTLSQFRSISVSAVLLQIWVLNINARGIYWSVIQHRENTIQVSKFKRTGFEKKMADFDLGVGGGGLNPWVHILLLIYINCYGFQLCQYSYGPHKICLIYFRISTNVPDKAYGRNARSREKASADFTFQSQSMTFGSNIV